MKIFWTKESLLRLQEIEKYISIDNPRAAMFRHFKLTSHLGSDGTTFRSVNKMMLMK